MNEQTSTPAPEQVVPVPVPAIPTVSRPAPSADQLPTARVQPLPPPLPPPIAPQGPAHKTQPLRAVTRSEAAAKVAVGSKRQRWGTVLAHARRAGGAVPASLRRLRFETWTERRVGLSCAAIGVAMIAGSLFVGWQSIASERLENVGQASLAVAIVLARASLAIAAMAVGYGLLRMGERLLRPHSDSDALSR